MLYRLIWIFFIYAFLGWCTEVSYAALVTGKFVNRGFLNGPVCPVYGLGALCILLLPPGVKASPLLLFLAGAGVATACEWGMSLFYEKLTGAVFWDYHALPWNFQGRVCLVFSLFWGLLALPLVYGLHPWLMPRLALIPNAVTIPAALFYLGDAATSLFLLRRLGTEGLRWYVRFRPSEAR